MKIALFLHIYQPPTQFQGLVERITEQSYEKIVSLLEEYPKAKVILNINASLTEQLDDAGFRPLINRIAELAENGQIEFTGSAAYHPILADLPKREISRQINLNYKINQSYFGSAYSPKGFFPPEMAYEEKVGEVVERLGYKWILVDGTGIANKPKFPDFIYKRQCGSLLVVPREDDISYKIAFGKVRTLLGLERAMGVGQISKSGYLMLAMDGETFGHHQPKQLKLLRWLFEAQANGDKFQLVTVSELLQMFEKRENVRIEPSTWGYTRIVDGKRIWVRWRNPDSPVHKLLNELRELAINSVHKGDLQSRKMLDRALNSDTYWWSSGSPCWHSGMVDRGSAMLCEVVQKSKSAKTVDKEKAMRLYSQILQTGFRTFGHKDIAC